MSEVILNCNKLYKSYYDGYTTIEVLKGVDFSIYQGDRVAIVGPSGSGKSTLLHLLGGLDNPSAGQVFTQGVDWQTLAEKNRCKLRNQRLGFVYQFHHLLSEFSALENVAMPLLLANLSNAVAYERARLMIAKIDLTDREHHKPAQLSGGERQRVAIARALVNQPQCILADEPTGNLDQATAAKIFALMQNLNSQWHSALVIVTHDMQLAKRMNKVIMLRDGNLVEQLC